MNRTQEFFSMLNKNPNENVYQLNSEFKQLKTTIQTAVANEPQQNIYFAINDFPTFSNGYILRHQDKVRRFNSFYVDIDIKSDQGEHLQEADLQANKQDIYTKLIALSCPPSAIVESRNGFHVYWIIDRKARQDCIPMRWRRLEGCIYHYIHDNISTGADSKATDATRVLRLQNSYHVKADSSSPFLVEVRYLSRCYTLVELEEHFPAVVQDTQQVKQDKDKAKKDKKQEKTQEIRALSPATSDIYNAINELDSEFFNYLTPINQELGWQEAEKMLKSQDIRVFLGVNVRLKESFKSVLRQDKSPSCTIYCNNGQYLYCDFGVGLTADIIRLVSTVANIKHSKAVKWLCSVYGIELLDTFKNGQTPIEPLINTNIQTLEATAKEAEKVGVFFVTSVIPLYQCIMEIWRRQVEEYGINNPSDCKLFLASRYLEEIIKKDRKSIRRQLLVLQALGIIKKVANSKAKINKGGNKINSYVIQELDADTILQKAQELQEKIPNPLGTITEKKYNMFAHSNYWGAELAI